MKVLVTGATGFVGRALVPRLLADGHQVVVQSRSVERAKNALGADVEVVSTDDAWSASLAGVEGIVNLAGEPIISGRWTEKKKKALVESRVDRTQAMVDAIGAMHERPKVLVSASAVGFYGSRGDEVLTEESSRGDDFLAELCDGWEQSAFAAKTHGVRVAALRIGVVLGRGGGALEKMLPAFKMGGGGKLGSGDQYMPWVHIADLVELMATALTDERYEGVFNATGPTPVDNKTFTSAMGNALHRPTIVPVPSFALKAIFGEASQVLLEGQRAEPKRAQALGFEFTYSTIDEALNDILVEKKSVTLTKPRELPESDYLKGRPVRRVLQQETWIDAPLEEVYAFFSKPQNLGAMTPPSMSFEIQTELPDEMSPGTEIEYLIRLGPVPMKWKTRIEEVVPMERFVDTQLKGPYASWHHVHLFERHGDRTKMIDRVHFAAPFGPLGWIAEQLFVQPQLEAIFGYRAQITALRFQGSRRSRPTNSVTPMRSKNKSNTSSFDARMSVPPASMST